VPAAKLPDLGPRYSPIRELGRGGMGRVLLVRDARLGRDVALKLLDRPPAPDAVEGIRREFDLLARMTHPGVVRVHDLGSIRGRPFFTSDPIRGRPLSALGRIDGRSALHLARSTAEALGAVHEAGILHLDLKPSNILAAGDPPRAVLIDFGLFRRGLPAVGAGRPAGSLPFMAPELFRGGRLGPWTDVYALGVTFYRILTGRYPRLPPSPPARRSDAVAWEPAPLPLGKFRPDLPAGLDAVIGRCLALDPSARFPSGTDVLKAIDAIGGEGGRPPSPAAMAPTVGRDAEIAEVDRFLDGVAARIGPPTLLIAGPRGMGATHLFREMKVRAQMKGLRFHLETGYPGRQPAPGSLLEPLEDALGGEARARWRAFVERIREPRRSSRNEVLEGERRSRRAGEVARAACALKEPAVLAADDLQLLDEVSIELALDLVRFLVERGPGERPPFALALGYREEGPAASHLRELTEVLLRPGCSSVITLRPLGLKETLELFRKRGGKLRGGETALELFRMTGGSPSRILSVASGGRAEKVGAGVEAGRAARGLPAGDARAVLLALVLLGRPAAEEDVARLVGLPPSRTERALEELSARGLAAPEDSGGGRRAWLPAPEAASATAKAGEDGRRRVHARIARSLARDAGGKGGPVLVEAFRHFREAGAVPDIVRRGPAAARWLEDTHQNSAALAAWHAVFAAIPRDRPRSRLAVALDLADLLARTGDLDAGIRILREVLRDRRGMPPGAGRKVVLWLATLHSRGGDFGRAEALFRKGLGKGAARGLGRQEFLFFLNEHAAMKAFLGRYREALDLCEEGLRLSRRLRALRSWEVTLQLHATKASVELRTFDLEGAIRDFRRSLEVARSIGSLENQAIVLNNLGIAYAQSDRYPEALRALRDAEAVNLRLDEGPSLASIYANLVLIHSKLGDHGDAARALAEADRLGPGAIGRRQELYLEHARGMAALYRGRFREARTHLEAAIRIGDALGDIHFARFGRAFRAECLIFEGAYSEARGELEALSDRAIPGRVRKAALARRALLAAVTSRAGDLERAAAEHGAIAGERPVPFLDAWDDLLLAWSFSIAGRPERGDALLDRASEYFRRHGLRPAASLASLVRAEGLFLRGDGEAARKVLDEADAAASDLAAVLKGALAARLALSGPADPAGGADLGVDLLDPGE
jgi:tetratricopeptide (TPR) repeat protein